jgi:hypothetical protein
MNDPTDDAADSTADVGPTLPRRQAKVREYRLAALDRADPLEANVGLMTADAIAITHGLAALVEADLAEPRAVAAVGKKLLQDAELYFKSARQADRFLQLERRRDKPPSADTPQTVLAAIAAAAAKESEKLAS